MRAFPCHYDDVVIMWKLTKIMRGLVNRGLVWNDPYITFDNRCKLVEPDQYNFVISLRIYVSFKIKEQPEILIFSYQMQQRKNVTISDWPSIDGLNYIILAVSYICKSVLHPLKRMFHVRLSRCSTDLRSRATSRHLYDWGPTPSSPSYSSSSSGNITSTPAERYL